MDFLTGELPEIAAKSIITVDRGYPSADMFEKFPPTVFARTFGQAWF
jgi:hypothetical protein